MGQRVLCRFRGVHVKGDGSKVDRLVGRAFLRMSSLSWAICLYAVFTWSVPTISNALRHMENCGHRLPLAMPISL